MRSLRVTVLLAACWVGGCNTEFREESVRDTSSRDVEAGSSEIESLPSGSVQTVALSTAQPSMDQLIELQTALLEKHQSIVADQAELARRQTAATDQLKEMGQLVHQQQKVVVAQVELARRQEVMADQLKELTIEVNGALTQLVMEFEMLQPKATWHARQIEMNRSAYTAIGTMLASLEERVFPTRNTWYGKAWQRLIEPFLIGRFPSVEQRDELVRLLDRIVLNDRRRVSILQGLPAPQYDENQQAAGHCLGPEWKSLRENLQELKY